MTAHDQDKQRIAVSLDDHRIFENLDVCIQIKAERFEQQARVLGQKAAVA